ncbi:hypothetical protein JR782_001010 [Salmonella enterica subsp. enterica serovar Eastbourne]|nr:hypothetical protein [Salmonella enterica subsp. enterica serovar Eastbourne]EHC5906702.1 hypothetical protein [Salmonella enterica subsp. enterica serovar Eastbourne]
MPQTTTTLAFERYKAQEAAGGRRVVLDEFVFANIPGLDAGRLPEPTEGLPDEQYIVHRQSVDRGGMVNDNTVVYTVTLPSTAGNFTFNWMALINHESATPAVITYLYPQQKIKNADGVQGNVLTYSEYMRYTGASSLTGIVTPASTWQIDFTARLHGMDEATRAVTLDIYGPALFLGDAFKVTATATPGRAVLASGAAYLRGLRTELDGVAVLTFETGKEQTVYLDSALTGSLTGENRATFTLISHETADYTDSLGFRHYVEPIARIAADGVITDLRKTGRTVSERLDGDFLTRDGNLSEIADKGAKAQAKTRGNIGLGNSATRDVGTTVNTVAAGNDARIIAAKKAIDDTQTGLSAQPVTLIKSVDDLSSLPSGAHRFARNNTGVTVLPTANLCYIDVLARHETANGTCIQVVDSATGDTWICLHSADPADKSLTWIQLNQTVKSLGLTATVNRAKNAVQKTGDTMTGNLILSSDERMHFIIQNADGSARTYFYKDKGGDGVRLNNGVDGGGDFVFGKNGEFYSPSNLHAGTAAFGNNGDVYGAAWGNAWLTSWLSSAFASRDNNINARATIDWVNQYFANKSTAGLGQNGWFKDASTGLIIQWGTTGGASATYTVNLPVPFPRAGLWALGWVAGALYYGSDDWSNSAGLINNSQISVTVDHGWSTAWLAIGY